jgi:hypothetical protein
VSASALQAATGGKIDEAAIRKLFAERHWRARNYKSKYRVVLGSKQKPDEQRVLYAAQEKQDYLHACGAGNILFGGAAGGTKSHGLRWHAIINALRRGGLKVLFLRRQYKELETTHLLKVVEEIPPEIASYHAQLKRLVCPNKSIVQFGHCHAEKDIASYLSTEWDLICVDEASEFTPRMLSLLQSRLRTKLAGVRPQLVLASNPGGEAHLWLYTRFILKKVDPKEDGAYKPDQYEFIPAYAWENPYLDDGYIDRLFSLPEAEREAYLFGNWLAFAGQYFREWAPSQHVIPPDPEILEDWFEVQGGMDWGYDPHPGIVLWAAFDGYGRPTLYKELKFELSSPREVAEMIVGRCETDAERRMTIIGDSQMWVRQVGSGVSIADEINQVFAELGVAIVLVQANKDRINGWMRVHQFLDPRRRSPEDRTRTAPYLRAMDVDDTTGLGCPYLIATIGAQMHSDKMDGDMKKMGNDHACDALRYLLMAREPLSIIPREKVGFATHEQRTRKHMKRLLEQAGRRHDEARAELDEGLDIEDTPMIGESLEDDDGELLLDGGEDIWN